jgi:hypothetical protein
LSGEHLKAPGFAGGYLLGPVLLFVPQLARAKQVGNLEYGMLADRYVREFDRK